MTTESDNPQSDLNTSSIGHGDKRIPQDAATALTELVKNSFDADAEWVRIEINADAIKVEDNGIGMTSEEIQNRWMNFSLSREHSDVKQETAKKRTRTGGKGFGRMGTMWLGDRLELYTKKDRQDEQLYVAFKWSDASNAPSSTAPIMIKHQMNNEPGGTTLVIGSIKDPSQWREPKIRELIASLTSKVFPLLDAHSFRVTLKWEGNEITLGEDMHKPVPNPDFHFELAWQKMTPQLIKEVTRFWDDHKMLKPGFSSEERARQVVWIVRHGEERKIVGLSTADVVTFKQLNNNNFYLYRSIILPGFRYPGLASKIIVETRDTLQSFSEKSKSPGCIGVLSFIENPRFQQFRREAIWKASKMAYIGTDKAGRHIRVYYFKGATI